MRVDVDAYALANPDFNQWIHEATENRISFLRLLAAWQRCDRLAALGAQNAHGTLGAQSAANDTVAPSNWDLPHMAGQTAGLGKNGPRRYRRLAYAGAAIAASIFGFVAIAPTLLEPQVETEQFATSIGGYETVRLSDGSQIELNTKTSLSAAISEDARQVTMQSGEAYFDIAHDADRPFTIRAGDQVITVLGTKFSVHYINNSVEVLVTEGRVQVDNRATPRVSATILTPGAKLHATRDHALVSQVTEDARAAELGWRDGVLVFDELSLGEVTQEFNRYNHIQLVIDDPAVAALNIGGRFNAANVEGFVRLLEDGFDVTVERRGRNVYIRG